MTGAGRPPENRLRDTPLPVGPLEAALVAEARDGRIACATVFRVAEAHGATPAEAGRAVERLGLKIRACQLGCFP